jgi:hypothetical protein
MAVFLQKGALAGTLGMDRIYRPHLALFIFLCGQENEPKETALIPGPFGLPCASRSRRDLWNSLALKQPQGLYRRPLRDAPQANLTP